MTRSLPAALLAAVFSLALPSEAGAQQPFRFIAMGDMPYGKPDQVYGTYRSLIEAVNARTPDFVIHIGDIKSGSTPCSNALLRDQLGFMNTIDSAVLYTPGDNEWTDCHRKKAGKFDPIERLAFLRRTFYAQGPRSLGKKPIALERQADLMPRYATYVENARFTRNGVEIVSAHVIGSNNNFQVRDPAAAREFFERDAADLAWLADSFDKAERQKARAVVVAIHADMFGPGFNMYGKEAFLEGSGFRNFGPALAARARAFGRPVLLVYGDSHIYRVTRPFMKSAPNLVGLEVYGSSDMHAVEVSVDPSDPAVFGFRPILNPALLDR